MDPLTEKLLERARARRETLARKMAESNMSPRKTTSTTATARAPLRDNQEHNRDIPIRSSVTVSPKKMRQIEPTVKPDTPAIPSVKSRMQRLAEQRKMWNSTNGTEVDSPQNVIPPKRPDFEDEENREETTAEAPSSSLSSSRSRFAALAATINSWEDDTHHPRHEFKKEKPATRKWQPPKRPDSTQEETPVPAKRSAPLSSNHEGTSASTQPSPPKRVKHEEAVETTVKREPSGKVGTRSDVSSGDETDASTEQPVPAPRAAKTSATAAPHRSPVKTHISSASPIKRPTLQACTAATPKIQSPKKQSLAKEPHKKVVTIKASPIKQSLRENSAVKASAIPRQSTTIQSSPVKQQADKPRGVPLRKGATSENFVRAMVLLQQGCGGGGASSRQKASPVKTQPKVGAIAQRIQDRLRENQDSWQKNEINKKVQEERQKELAIIRGRWENPKADARGPTKETQPQPAPEEEPNVEEMEEEENYQGQETEEEDMEEEGTAEEDGSEVNYSADEEEEEEEEIVPTAAPRETASIEENSGFVAMTIERSAIPANQEEDRLDVEQRADESEVNISDVLGDIDELIVEAEQAMQAEQASKQSDNSERSPDEGDIPTANPQADISGWDYNIDKMEPIYASVTKPSNTSNSSGDGEGPVPAPRLRRKSSSDSSTCSSTVTPHSLESYRSQQKVTKSPAAVTHRTVTRETAARTVVREPSTASSIASTSSAPSSSSRSKDGGQRPKDRQRKDGKRSARKINPRDKIQALMEEVSTQQSIIHQTSQALELIAATEEYQGTKEEIEAERLLVVATQRRQACLSEIQYLKNPIAKPKPIVTEDGEEIVPCRGSVTVRDIRLPLKTQYLMALDSGRDQAHHSFFVIVRCQEHVIATQILSTRDVSGDCIHFNNMVCLNDLGSDFTIEVLVYEMRGRCPTLDAVHSKKAATSKHGWSLTPKKLKSGGSTMRHGGRNPQSPAPSHQGSVRQNSFAMVGSVRLSLASCQLKKVTLSKVPFLSPLEGSVHLTMSCHTDSQTHAEGFLTMFDDCSGLGMWHRRWCVLHGGNLSFWKYPGDEKRKPPIGTVNLKECITQEVRLISRIHCARPNTFELQTSRPASRADRDTLVSKHNNSHTITKHLLSADTKEDRVEWTTALNKTLLELRLWCKDAAKPVRE
ncbi:anillin-like isoform X2 [Diadema setosum]|uniref:anillin-like isoform X2 n=1 Tax=Diadema setosum TaxID=31175 RepID=UPI003B3B3ED6